MIKSYRKNQDTIESDTIFEIRVYLKSVEGFNSISDYLTIVDLPGIEDGFKSGCIKNFVAENQENIFPVLLVNLTQGAFEELKQFEDYNVLFSDQYKPIPIVFTKFYNMLNDIANELRQKGITKQSNP